MNRISLLSKKTSKELKNSYSIFSGKVTAVKIDQNLLNNLN